MPELTRFSVSLEKDLLDAFDKLVQEEGYPTRSEAIKALLRKALVEEEWKSGGMVAGALLIVYDHHKHDLLQNLMHVQHDYGSEIVSSQHVHLDHYNCLEMVTVKGRVDRIRKLVAAIHALKGIKHSSLTMTAAGEQVP